MNETLGNIIMRLRKEKELTQEQLANALGITYQAVSKWETGVSSPDIAMLPLLADIFEVSIDELFGRTAPSARLAPRAAEPENSAAPQVVELPWPDDPDMLHVVLFAGHRLIGGDERGEHLYSRRSIEFSYTGPALNIWSDFSVSCGDVQGSVTAGGNVDCCDVRGGVDAQGNVNCDAVGQDVSAGGSVNCDDVGGSVFAGGSVACDDVAGNVSAFADVNCDAVRGSVSSGGDVNCESAAGDIINGFAVDLGEKLCGLGEKLSGAMNKGRKKAWRFDRSWSAGDRKVEVHVDLKRDSEDE